jgi:hypothetical protein
VVVHHALAGSVAETVRLGEFFERLETYFEGDGRIIDQAYQARLGDGMIRCYMVHGEVVGFGQQYVTALLPSATGRSPSPRVMYDAHKPEFQSLRTQLEVNWIPELLLRLDIRTEQLPAIWDADFLYGPKNKQGDDTYVLCELNVSCVFPFPDPALPALARATARAADNARRSRAPEG